MADTPRDQIKKLPIVDHHEIPETFADTLGNIVFDGTTLRIEFTVARVSEFKPPQQPVGERHVVCRLVLSPPCAVDLINHMNRVGGELSKAGVITTAGASKPN
jgi:hypothetical protein